MLDRRVAAASLALFVACGPSVSVEDQSGATTEVGQTSTGSTPDSSTTLPPPGTSTTTTPPGTTTIPPDTGTTTSGTDSSGEIDPTVDPCDCLFLCPPCPPRGCPGHDPSCGEVFECDVIEQDCPEDEKCMPWANDGSSIWNASRCAPVDANPASIGEPCEVEGSAWSGIDSCDVSQMCFYVGKDNTGTCVGFCGGSAQDPICPDGQSCSVTNDGTLPLCLPSCDPLQPTCPEGEGCFPALDDTFVCLPAPTESIASTFTCHLSGGCEPGTICLPTQFLPECEDDGGCCTTYCDLDDPVCPPDLECLPFFEEGSSVDFDHLGVCSTKL